MAPVYPEPVIHIYGLCDPRTGALRYIGRAKNPARRLIGHLSKAKTGSPQIVHRWIRVLQALSLKPELFVIEQIEEPRWVEAETFWIQYFRYIGADLLNQLAPGADGNPYRATPELREKLSKSHKGKPLTEAQWIATANRYYPRGAEHRWSRQNLSAEARAKTTEAVVRATRGKKLTQEHKQKCSEALRGRKFSEEHRRRMSEAIRKTGYRHGPEVLAKFSARMAKTYWARSPEGEELVFSNMLRFCQERGFPRQSIGRVLSGRCPTWRGWQFRILETQQAD